MRRVPRALLPPPGTLQLYSRLNQPHNVHKAILARVVLLLSSGDPVAAQREFEKVSAGAEPAH